MDHNTGATPASHTELVSQLTAATVDALQLARGNAQALELAVQAYFTKALAEQLSMEEIEDILGVNDPCIMDLAGLSDTDEDIVIDAFEALVSL